jgi:hypothetical protein
MTTQYETFEGSTREAPFLGAEFWKKGKRIEGQVEYVFQTQNGPSSAIQLQKPVQLNGKSVELVSIGNLKGFMQALRDANVPNGLQAGDLIILECIGTTETTKGNPQINFKIAVRRPKDNSF